MDVTAASIVSTGGSQFHSRLGLDVLGNWGECSSFELNDFFFRSKVTLAKFCTLTSFYSVIASLGVQVKASDKLDTAPKTGEKSYLANFCSVLTKGGVCAIFQFCLQDGKEEYVGFVPSCDGVHYVYFCNRANLDFDIGNVVAVFSQRGGGSSEVPVTREGEESILQEIRRVNVLDRPWESWLDQEQNQMLAVIGAAGQQEGSTTTLRKLYLGSRTVPNCSSKKETLAGDDRAGSSPLGAAAAVPAHFQLDSTELKIISAFSKPATSKRKTERSHASEKNSRRSKLKPLTHINSKATVALAEATNRERMRRKKRNRPSSSIPAQYGKKLKKYAESADRHSFLASSYLNGLSPKGTAAGENLDRGRKRRPSPRPESRRKALDNFPGGSNAGVKPAQGASSSGSKSSCASVNLKNITNACRAELQERYSHSFGEGEKHFESILRFAIDTTKMILSVTYGGLDNNEIEDEVLRRTAANNCEHAITNIKLLSKG